MGTGAGYRGIRSVLPPAPRARAPRSGYGTGSVRPVHRHLQRRTSWWIACRGRARSCLGIEWLHPLPTNAYRVKHRTCPGACRLAGSLAQSLAQHAELAPGYRTLARRGCGLGGGPGNPLSLPPYPLRKVRYGDSVGPCPLHAFQCIPCSLSTVWHRNPMRHPLIPHAQGMPTTKALRLLCS